MFLIKFILFLFLFFVVVIVLTAVKFAWKVRELMRGFRQNGQPQDDYTGYQHRQTGYQHRQADGSTIIDQRSQQEKQTKIFEDNEGEYVEYEEQ